jgi:predicted nucleic acid-binding protein
VEDSGTRAFLIDSSAAHRITRPAALAGWRSALKAGRVGMCAATEAEVLYSAKSPHHYAQLRQAFAELYTWHVIPDDVWDSVLDLQESLAAAGCHRSAGMADLLVAVTAMHHRLTLLHYDHDFETIARHSDLETRWLADPGTLD